MWRKSECDLSRSWGFYDVVMSGRLPGADLVEQGLVDLRERRETVEALLVSIGAARLAASGHEVGYCEEIEPELYRYPAIDPGSFRRRVEAVTRVSGTP